MPDLFVVLRKRLSDPLVGRKLGKPSLDIGRVEDRQRPIEIRIGTLADKNGDR